MEEEAANVTPHTTVEQIWSGLCTASAKTKKKQNPIKAYAKAYGVLESFYKKSFWVFFSRMWHVDSHDSEEMNISQTGSETWASKVHTAFSKIKCVLHFFPRVFLVLTGRTDPSVWQFMLFYKYIFKCMMSNFFSVLLLLKINCFNLSIFRKYSTYETQSLWIEVRSETKWKPDPIRSTFASRHN